MTPTSVVRARKTLSPHVHRMITRVWRPLGSARFRAAAQAAGQTGTVKINIGSGREPVPGWVNTDIVWQGRLYLDALNPWPVEPGSVEFIYADNVIEHIPLRDANAFMRNAFEALRPGGVMRLATPDVEAIAKQYLENGDSARAGLERNRELGNPMEYPVELLRQVYVGAKHYLGFCYDYASLSAEMNRAGFDTKRVATGESEHPELAGLEARTHAAEAATQLVVEGVKPSV